VFFYLVQPIRMSDFILYNINFFFCIFLTTFSGVSSQSLTDTVKNRVNH
jgi:hypothetical protein